MSDAEFGKCEICGKESILSRKYYNYEFRCVCCSPNHFEVIRHCTNCVPKEPTETRVVIKTSSLKKLDI